jgi:L-alanine-DL-glutamate epimerase-like enolase superfamily enzyme
MTATATRVGAAIDQLDVAAYTIRPTSWRPTGRSRGTPRRSVVVHARAGGERGLGYTYADVSTAKLIECNLGGVVQGLEALDPPAAWAAMVRAIRNLGRPGIASMAIAAVDLALWDLKCKAASPPVCKLLGMRTTASRSTGRAGSRPTRCAGSRSNSRCGWSAEFHASR